MTDATRPTRAVSRGPATGGASGTLRAAARRWPTALGLALGGVNLADLGDGTEFSVVLLLAAVGYLLVAVLGRPRATWPLLFALLGLVVVLRLAGVDERPALLALGGVAAAVGLVRGVLRRGGLESWQVPAGLLFTAAALVPAVVPIEVGARVVAVALVAHAGWDAVHWWRRRIVVRSFAEWCGVLDLTLGVGILALV